MKYIIELEDQPVECGRKKLYKASGFNSIVFDEEGLRRLKPYEESEAEMRCAEKAWEIAKMIFLNTDDGGMSYDELYECFGLRSFTSVAKQSYQEVAEKYEAWAKKHDEIRIGDEIKNIVMDGEKGIVIDIDEKRVRGFSLTGRYYFNWKREDIRKTGLHFPEIEKFMRKWGW